jgi:glycosyltransferase involved in cell wall biosynthesis
VSARRIGVLTQYFEPEVGAAQLRYAAITRCLRDEGADVEVVTSTPNYPTGATFEAYRGRVFFRETVEGIPIRRAWSYPATGSGLRRVLNFVSFALMALWPLVRMRRVDLLLAETPPITVAFVGLVVSKLRRFRFGVYVSDLSAESLGDLDLGGAGRLQRGIGALERFIYRRADVLTTVTDGLVASLRDRYGVDADRIVLLPNGADTEVFRPLPPTPASEIDPAFEGVGDYVLYAGTHGYAHGLDVLLDAAAELAADGIWVLFVGDGSDRDRLVKEASARGLTNVIFAGSRPPETVARLYAGAIAGLSSVRDITVMAGARPAKVLACLACGRPIVYSGRGEGADLVRASGAGLVTEPGDGAAVARAVRQLRADPDGAAEMGAKGRAFVEQRFGWPALVRDWLEAVAGGSPR